MYVEYATEGRMERELELLANSAQRQLNLKKHNINDDDEIQKLDDFFVGI